MSTDAIVLLKNEHKEIRKTFRAFEKAGEQAYAAKGRARRPDHRAADRAHLLENEVMYPRGP